MTNLKSKKTKHVHFNIRKLKFEKEKKLHLTLYFINNKEEQNSMWKLKVQNHIPRTQSHIFMYKILKCNNQKYKIMKKFGGRATLSHYRTHLCSDLYFGTIKILLFYILLFFIY